ncbi:hypothetical protein AC1031_010168 [Aphanomyces cochlioides]|nr:hypothetical protein AC1031_010168 [Aphanomyces cochlioides]
MPHQLSLPPAREICLSGGGLIKLSEQDLVSCSGAGDCVRGGYPANAIDYAAKSGVCLLKDYPYISGNDDIVHDCVSSCTKQNVNVQNSYYLYGEASYLSVMQAQPVAVFVYTGEDFMA